MSAQQFLTIIYDYYFRLLPLLQQTENGLSKRKINVTGSKKHQIVSLAIVGVDECVI